MEKHVSTHPTPSAHPTPIRDLLSACDWRLHEADVAQQRRLVLCQMEQKLELWHLKAWNQEAGFLGGTRQAVGQETSCSSRTQPLGVVHGRPLSRC